jgi:hypothetical protein
MDPADTPVYLRGFNAAPEFEKIIRNFDKSSRKRIKYYKQYVSSGTLTEQQKGVQLFGVYAPTSNDNNSQFYINTLRESYYNQTISSSTHSTELDLSEEERYLLYEGDIHVAVEKFLGAKIFMGGISDAEYFKWQQKREEKEEGGGSPY